MATSSISLPALRARIARLLQAVPGGDGDVKVACRLEESLTRTIRALEKIVGTIEEVHKGNHSPFVVLEHHEDPTRPIDLEGQPKLVMSTCYHLLTNCLVFSRVFELKASDANFDPFDMIAYVPSPENTRDSEYAIKEKCVYISDLMQCDFVVQRDGYGAISKLQKSQVISHLMYWNRWLTKNKFPSTCTPEEHQETLNVAGFFGASARSLQLAAEKYELEVPIINGSEILNPRNDNRHGESNELAVDDFDDSTTRNINESHLSSTTSVVDNNPPSNSEAVPLSPNVPQSLFDETTSTTPSISKVATAETLKYVIILKREFPVEEQKKLSAEDWGKRYTSSYIKCWKVSLAEAAPRLWELINMRETGSLAEVGASELRVSDSHVWCPGQSEESNPHCLYPQLFFDEVTSDFADEWDQYDEVVNYTSGRANCKEIMWLALQFWIRFIECNGVDNPPQRTHEERILNEEVVRAVGKWLGASRSKLERFDYTWGTKMKSNDPNNTTRKRGHGFGGANYYPIKGGNAKKQKK